MVWTSEEVAFVIIRKNNPILIYNSRKVALDQDPLWEIRQKNKKRMSAERARRKVPREISRTVVKFFVSQLSLPADQLYLELLHYTQQDKKVLIILKSI